MSIACQASTLSVVRGLQSFMVTNTINSTGTNKILPTIIGTKRPQSKRELEMYQNYCKIDTVDREHITY